jgi:ABC-type polysaccharide/polyol phosphate export permease
VLTPPPPFPLCPATTVLAYFIASIAPNLEVANAVLPTYVVTFLFFAGFLFRLEDIPKYWRWYSYVEPLTYSWGAMMANQFEAVDPVWIEGKTVLEYYGLKSVDKWAYIGYLSLFFLVFFVLTWTALRYKNYQQR